jgi:cell wall-associated NlpC family hydrolase
LTSFVISVSCSSSSSERYGTRTDEKQREYSPRFTSENDTLIVDLNLDLKDPSDLPAEEPDIPITTILEQEKTEEKIDVPGFDYSTIREKMLMEIIKYLDTPYKYGGTTKSGIDCSAFTQNIFKDVFNIGLERSARLQFKQGMEISEKDKLMFGDLVFFNTRKRVKPGHVGIYIGENLFAHASSTKGVTISSIDYDYYSRRYMGARRFEINGITEKTQ